MRRLGIFFSLALCVVAGCGDDGGASTSPSADADGDGISNADEGNSTNVNTDGDEFPDWLDYDSDGDGILDADEAGDKDLTTAVRDTDADGAPDFRDIDSDGDGWKDNQELDAAFAIVDTDGDGTPDFVDLDSDGDSISDKHEFAGEPDKDNIPNFRDDDSDGDGIKDALEAGDADIVSPPVDTDGDMIPDFLDVDSDGDFVPDAQEDPNGNGMVDPGESSPLSADTDGDGTPDLVEKIAGSDPNDPAVSIPAGDFYFVLPYLGAEKSGQLDFTTNVRQADVFISVDTTGSFGEEIAAIQAALDNTIVPGVRAVITDAAFGVGRFEDMPLAPFGLPGDKPYELLQPITTDVAKISNGLSLLPPAAGGLDVPEAGYESLYQWASGTGLPDLGYGPFAPMGSIGGVGFRKDALPIILQITDAISHEAIDYQTVVPGAHSKQAALGALAAIGARVVGIDSLENVGTPNDPRAQLEELAISTKAVIPPDINTGKCLTGVAGAPKDPTMVGGKPVCPVVFDVKPDGSGLGDLITSAVVQLAQLGVLDISTDTIGVTNGLKGEVVTPGFTTADFIKSITPVAPPPSGATIDGDIFRGVTPGSTVKFDVKGYNDFQKPLEVDQLFAADIRVLGDLVTVLDVRKVYIIVPREIPEPPPIPK